MDRNGCLRAAFAVACAFWGQRASAHTFGAGTDAFQAFAEGANAVLVVAGAATAMMAALFLRHSRAEATLAGFVVGLLTMLVSLEGHAFLDLALPVYAGIFFGASFGVAVGAGIARIAIERLTYPWLRIGLRIAASWLAAIQVLMAAFLLAPSP